MGRVIEIRSDEPIRCRLCGNNKWKIFVENNDDQVVKITRIRCTNCMNEIRIFHYKQNGE